MSINLFFFIVIGMSLAALAIIVYRKIPLLANLSNEEIMILFRKKGLIQKIKEVNWKEYWFRVIVFLEKLLHRAKINFLKIDNLLGKWIKKLRTRSRLMAQKSKEWIKQKEMKRQEKAQQLMKKTNGTIPVKIINKEKSQNKETEEEEDLPISELKKPIEEEQKWIDLIIENPKNITAYKFLGLLYWRQHNYLDAKNSLEVAVKLGSKDKKVKEILKKIKEMGIE